MKSVTEKNQKKRRFYDASFKEQAVALAKEIGVPEAAEKLGIKNTQVLASWARENNRKSTDAAYAELQALKEENKKLKRDLDKEKKVTAILRDATVFFCQDHQK